VGADEHEETDSFASYEAMVNELTKEDESTSLSGLSFSTDETDYEHRVYPNVDQSQHIRPSAIPKRSLSVLNPAAHEFVMHVDAERAQIRKSLAQMEQQWLKQKVLLENRMKCWHPVTRYDVQVQAAVDAIDAATVQIRIQNPRNCHLRPDLFAK